MWQRLILCWCIWNMHAFLNLKISFVCAHLCMCVYVCGTNPWECGKLRFLLLAAKNTQPALLISIWNRLVSITERHGLMIIWCPRGSYSECYKMLNIIFLYLISSIGAVHYLVCRAPRFRGDPIPVEFNLPTFIYCYRRGELKCDVMACKDHVWLWMSPCQVICPQLIKLWQIV